MLNTQRFDIARKYPLVLASSHDCMAFADDEGIGRGWNALVSLLPDADRVDRRQMRKPHFPQTC
jgi:hypothetical protein